MNVWLFTLLAFHGQTLIPVLDSRAHQLHCRVGIYIWGPLRQRIVPDEYMACAPGDLQRQEQWQVHRCILVFNLLGWGSLTYSSNVSGLGFLPRGCCCLACYNLSLQSCLSTPHVLSKLLTISGVWVFLPCGFQLLIGLIREGDDLGSGRRALAV